LLGTGTRPSQVAASTVHVHPALYLSQNSWRERLWRIVHCADVHGNQGTGRFQANGRAGQTVVARDGDSAGTEWRYGGTADINSAVHVSPDTTEISRWAVAGSSLGTQLLVPPAARHFSPAMELWTQIWLDNRHPETYFWRHVHDCETPLSARQGAAL